MCNHITFCLLKRIIFVILSESKNLTAEIFHFVQDDRLCFIVKEKWYEQITGGNPYDHSDRRPNRQSGSPQRGA